MLLPRSKAGTVYREHPVSTELRNDVEKIKRILVPVMMTDRTQNTEDRTQTMGKANLGSGSGFLGSGIPQVLSANLQRSI